jgi:hypothetical protein
MQMQSLADILFQIDSGVLALPRFQRGYVWRRADVSELMLSLYKGYPVGHFLVWDTQATKRDIRGDQHLAEGMNKLLLDGQQRVTSLYGIIRGKKPMFSDGDEKAFRCLYFNVEEESFEFHSSKMNNDPLWISVTKLMHPEASMFEFADRFDKEKRTTYGARIERIIKIKDRQFFVETVTSAEKTLDDVVDIFNRVNSGGTKLTDGDLALAKISAKYPDAREEMQTRLTKWQQYGYWFSMDWLLRCINAIVTGQSKFQFIADVSAEDFRDGLIRAEKRIDSILTLIRSRLGLVDSSVLRSHNSFPAMIRFLEKEQKWPTGLTQNKLLYWYIVTLMWGYFSTSVEGRVRQSLVAVDDNEDEVDALIGLLKQSRGHLRVTPQDFDVAEARSRIFPILYLLTRVNDVPDFCSGLPLSKTHVGAMGELERHHIFPNAYLRDCGISNRYQRNALANFTWLTQPCNKEISAKPPEEYFLLYNEKHPGVLEKHWIPMDKSLWKVENYQDFLAARRELLAQAANDFLNSLLHDTLKQQANVEASFERVDRPRPISIDSDVEEATLKQVMNWMELQGLPRGEYGKELVDLTGNLVATLDLAWPEGIQQELSEKVALLIDEESDVILTASQFGYRCYSSIGDFKQYVQHEMQYA